jgi:chitinase
MTTSTVYTTTTRTVTSCAPTVTNCPGGGYVTTEVIALYTTVCPVTATETKTRSPWTSSAPAGGAGGAWTTSTGYSTPTYTITSCAPTVTNCPAKLGQVTTEVVAEYHRMPRD